MPWAAVIYVAELIATEAWLQLAYVVLITASTAYSLTNRPSSAGGKPRQTAASLDRGQLQNSRIISAPTPLIYGHTRVGNNQPYIGVSGADNQYLHIIANIGEGELNGIVQSGGVDQIWLEDKLYTEFPGLVYYEFFNGSSTQAVCSTLKTAIPEWNEPKKYMSYLYMRLKYDRDKFQSMPNITVEIEGLKVYNPDTEVTEYSNNPALCALDFMTRSSRRGGMGFDINRIDLDSVIDTATYCTAKGWTCDLYLNENQSASDNFLQILATFRGVLVYSESKFKLKYRDLNYESSVMTLTEADVIEQGSSGLKISQPSIFSTPNAVNCKFTNAEKKFTQDDYVLADSEAIAADGDYREEQIDLLGVTSQANVMKLANYYLERLRLNKKASLPIGSRGMALEPFDLVALTHSRPGWAAKQFRATTVNVTQEGVVALGLEEEFASMYDDTYNLSEHVYHDTNLPSPSDTVPSVINVTSSEEIYDYRGRTFTRWKVDFDKPLPAVYPFWDYANIYIRIGLTGDWKFMTKSEGDYYLDPVEEGVTYYCKIVSVSIFGTQQAFDDGYMISKTIQGKTAVPANLTGLTAIAAGDTVTIFADELSEPDIKMYEIRLGAWEGGLYIASNESPNFRLVGVRPGTHVFYAKAQDNSGNYSTNAVSATVEVFYPSGYVDVDTWPWDFDGIGTFNNTEHETYEGVDALKCSHLSSLFENRGVNGVWFWDGSGSWVRINTDVADVMTSLGTTLFANFVTYGLYKWTAAGGWVKINLSDPAVGLVISGGELYGNFIGYGVYRWTGGTSWTYYGTSMPTADPVDALTGTWLSPEYDLGSIIPIRIWGDFVAEFEASTGSWAAIFPGTTTWTEKATALTRWYELLAPEYAGLLSAKLYWGDTSGNLINSAEKLELLGIEISARYVQVKITITDPDADSNLHLKTLNMTAAYW